MPPSVDLTRHSIATACAAFKRLPDSEHAVSLRRAAVAIVLTTTSEGHDTALLLTLRASHMRAHRGQWALPGGRCDEGESAVDAALRELDEELGLRLAPDVVLGLLDDYATRSGYLITPVMVWAGHADALLPNPEEVASVHRIPLAAIASTSAFDFISIPESPRPVIRFHHALGTIHAPTAALIYQFREVLAGRATRVNELEQPVFAWT